MSLIDIVKAQGQHRGLPAWKLRSLLQDAELRVELAEITSEERQQQLDAAGIEISGLLYDLEQERAARKTAEEEGIRLQAALDNATSVSVAAGTRDIWPGEEPTHPIDVSEIRARYGGTASSSPAEYVPMRLSAAAEAGLL
jgi:hypothetical protein